MKKQETLRPLPDVGYGAVPVILFCVMACAVLCAGNALAYGGGGGGGGYYGTPMKDVLCEIVDWFSGNLGRGLATIGVSAVAIGAIFGKVSWGLALTVITGVVVMFGASQALVDIGVISAGVC